MQIKPYKDLGTPETIVDSNVYFKRIDGLIIILIMYFNDLDISRSGTSSIQALKLHLTTRYEMTDLAPMQKILGIQFLQICPGTLVHQT